MTTAVSAGSLSQNTDQGRARCWRLPGRSHTESQGCRFRWSCSSKTTCQQQPSRCQAKRCFNRSQSAGQFRTCCVSVPSAAKQQNGPDVSRLSAELHSQWDHRQNAYLGNIIIFPGSQHKVHWICTQCPDGHPHRWQAGVQSRVNNRGCPFCSGQAVCPHNSLGNKAPHPTKEWDTAKNPDSPYDYTLSSGNRAHWKCSQGHQWQARIYHRTQFKSGCPVCAKARPRKRLPALTASTSHVKELWDEEKNRKAGLDPDKLTCGSSKTAHFTCDQCLFSQPHRWTARIKNVVRGTGCPYCSRRKVCKCNSLQTCRPDLAAEWCCAKNHGTPSDQSGEVVWWENATRGQWKESISVRSFNVPKLEVSTVCMA